MKKSNVMFATLFVALCAASCLALDSELIDAPPPGSGSGGSDVGKGGDDLDGLNGTGGGSDTSSCVSSETEDRDMDGFSVADGDCNDCDANVNPNAVEVLSDDGSGAADEDCDGEVDELDDALCDDGLTVDDADPKSAAKAIGLCKVSSGAGDWGLVSAQWVLADGAPPPSYAAAAFHLGHGILPSFGPHVSPRHGKRMLALSSGTARQPTDPGYQSVLGFEKQYNGSHPTGFPKESPACPGVISGEVYDATGVELTVRTPSNAHGIAFDFDFYTFEWPNFICDIYNDFFVALLEPYPTNQLDGNIAFDTQGNPISVNNAFMEVCGCDGNPPAACSAGGKSFDCSLGDIELLGTGFGFDTGYPGLREHHAATSWLTTSAPVEPGTEITIRFAVYDSADMKLDSTTLVDHFRWIATPGVPVETVPVPR